MLVQQIRRVAGIIHEVDAVVCRSDRQAEEGAYP
jgi:hypothetical protein